MLIRKLAISIWRGSIALGLIFLVLPGCASIYDWQEDTGHGKTRILHTPFEVVWLALPETIDYLGLELWDENKKERYILARRQSTGSSYGEKIAVFANPLSDSMTQVKVVSKRKWHSNVMAKNWEEPILDTLEQILSGPLPDNETTTEETQDDYNYEN